MKFQYKDQQFQVDAVNAVTSVLKVSLNKPVHLMSWI